MDAIKGKVRMEVWEELSHRVKQEMQADDSRVWVPIDRALGRYFELLAEARTSLKEKFTHDEVKLLCDACNGTWFAELVYVKLLPASVQEAIEDEELDEKWGVDGEAFLSKLKGLDILSLCALVDGVERYWAGPFTRKPIDVSSVLG